MDRNKIAQLAYLMPTKDRNKEAVFDVVMNLLDDRSLSENDLAILYAQAIQTKPARPRKPEKWVANAVAKNDIREYLQYIYSDGKRIMGTDGHRLHIWYTDKYPKGFYNPKTMAAATVPNDFRFPDVERVIPKTNSKDYAPSSTIEVSHLSVVMGLPLIGYKFGPVAVNANYLDEALAGFAGYPLIYYVDGNSAVKIEEDNKLAVVMPVRQ